MEWLPGMFSLFDMAYMNRVIANAFSVRQGFQVIRNFLNGRSLTHHVLQTAPAKNNFYVPYHETLGQIIHSVLYQSSIPASTRYTDTAGAGLLGSTHTERGLTFVTVNGAGHGRHFLHSHLTLLHTLLPAYFHETCQTV